MKSLFINDQYIKVKSILNTDSVADKLFSLTITNNCRNTSNKWDLKSFRPNIPALKNKDGLVFYESIKKGKHYLIPRYIYTNDTYYINIR